MYTRTGYVFWNEVFLDGSTTACISQLSLILFQPFFMSPILER